MKGPPRAGRPWNTYMEIAAIWQLKERSPITTAMLDVAWPSFFQFFRQHPTHDTLIEEFTSGADHYRTQGWHLPQWRGIFSSRAGHPVMNVLRHATRKKEEPPRVETTRPSQERREQILRHYAENPADRP